MANDWVSDLYNHLRLSRTGKEWKDLVAFMTEVIKAYFNLLPSAPSATQQPGAIEKTVDHIVKEQGRYFPPHRRSKDSFLLRRYIISKVGSLRGDLKKSLMNRKTNDEKQGPEKQTRKLKRNPLPKNGGSTTKTALNPMMTLRSQDEARNPSTKTSAAPPVLRKGRENSDGLTAVPVNPSRLRSSKRMPISERLHRRNQSIVRNVPVRPSTKKDSTREKTQENQRRNVRKTSKSKVANTLAPPLPPSRATSNPATNAGSSSHSSPPPSQVSDLLTFLEKESLAQLYPYLRDDGYNMKAIEDLSKMDFTVINMVLDMTAKKVVLRGETGGDTAMIETGLEPIHWRLFAAKIYQLGLANLKKKNP